MFDKSEKGVKKVGLAMHEALFSLTSHFSEVLEWASGLTLNRFNGLPN